MSRSTSPIRVAYVGALLSGCHASLTAVQRANGIELEREPRRGPVRVRRATRDGPAVEAIIPSHRGPVWLARDDPRYLAGLRELRAAVGLVFVVDSQIARRAAVLEAWAATRADLRAVDAGEEMPIVLQINKRDLPRVCEPAWVRENLRVERAAYVESIAPRGIGTTEALDALLALCGHAPRAR